jgi:hypothetical protein
MAIPIQVVFDCADPPVLAKFWADALGYQLQGPPEPTAMWQNWAVEHGIPGGPPGTPLAERHVRVDEAVERLATSGAAFLTASTRYGEYCVTMRDPEGNEFDVQ